MSKPTLNTKHNVTVVGAGAWGTALAIHLARCGHQVTLWGRGEHKMEKLASARQNERYLPGILFPDNLMVASDWQQITSLSHHLLIAVPSHAFAAVIEGLHPYFNEKQKLIWATKGLDGKSHRLLDEVVQEICGARQLRAILSGPSFATEVGRECPTAVVVASPQQALASEYAVMFSQDYFRVYTSDDMTGVQLGGALKNVIAIAVGIADGLKLGANARSALITRGLAELTRLGLALGAQQKTFMGLTGVGDLVLTCTDDQSRNRRMGLALAQGHEREAASKNIGQVVEGAQTAELMLTLAKKQHIEMPITQAIFAVLNGKLRAKDVVKKLLSRDLTRE